MLEVFLDVILDSVKILPFLYIAYLIVELIERKTNLSKMISGSRFGSLPGAALGLIPQCGFTPAAANLFSSGLISLGTLVAVLISTSDEAIIILFSSPGHLPDVLFLILSKFLIAVAAGLIIDVFSKRKKAADGDALALHDKGHCKCCHENIFYAALKHTLVIFVYIFVFFLVFEFLIYFIGEDKLAAILLKDSFFQPFVTALFGFIPSCASSVLLTNLYIDGTLSFASVLAGLITNSGVGLLVLFKVNKKHIGQNFKIAGILYLVAVLSGVIFQLFI
ncbi:MAG: arsenic efflux protein [Clostridiales bacterium]|jgi:hypothetical protein|nr:arsenic efflux protein [Clostridiales bacterium]